MYAAKELGVIQNVTTDFNEFSDTIPGIKNNSDHGIDVLVQDHKGKWVPFEVKTSINAKPLKLSADQNRGANFFANSRLPKAKGKLPWWGGIDDSVQNLADDILSNQSKFKGYVVQITNYGKNAQKVKFYDWVNNANSKFKR